MMTITRSSSENPDFIALVRLLDEDLARKDGKDHSFYAQFNKIDKIRHVVLAYENEKPVACGAMKPFGEDAMEIKRMFVLPEKRNMGIATQILFELERWAAELNYKKCALETGKRQPDAIELYKKHGFRLIPNYGQYKGVENSLCFEKPIG